MKCSRAQLLVSVRSADEATIALEADADIIDIKEPDRGSLGAADAKTIAAVIATVAGRCPVSAAMGELVDYTSTAQLPAGLTYAKVGLNGAARLTWRADLSRLFATIAHAAPIAVAYVDHESPDSSPTPSPIDVLDWAIDAGAAGILLDTCRKSSGDLLRLCSPAFLRDFVDRAREFGLLVAFAGSLQIDSLPAALEFAPDIVAVRGAACIDGDRRQSIDRQRVRDLAALIAAHDGPPRGSRPTPATCRGD